MFKNQDTAHLLDKEHGGHPIPRALSDYVEAKGLRFAEMYLHNKPNTTVVVCAAKAGKAHLYTELFEKSTANIRGIFIRPNDTAYDQHANISMFEVREGSVRYYHYKLSELLLQFRLNPEFKENSNILILCHDVAYYLKVGDTNMEGILKPNGIPRNVAWITSGMNYTSVPGTYNIFDGQAKLSVYDGQTGVQQVQFVSNTQMPYTHENNRVHLDKWNTVPWVVEICDTNSGMPCMEFFASLSI